KLDLAHLCCTDAGLRALAESRGLANLRELSLRQCDAEATFTTRGMLRVLNSDRLPALHALKLADGLPRSFNLSDLLRDKGIARLTKLTLFGEGTSPVIAAIARNPAASGLREVYLDGGEIDRAAAHYLTESPHLGGLTLLRMRRMNNGGRRLPPEDEERL